MKSTPTNAHLLVRAVRKSGVRDRFYVERVDGTLVSWEMTTYGERLPHDLVHLAAESTAGLMNGVWGRVSAGADLGAISRVAKQVGGTKGYGELVGSDPQGLIVAEALANAPWLEGEETLEEYWACVPELLAGEGFPNTDVRSQICALVAEWTGHWVALQGRGTLVLEWDLRGPARLVQ